MDTAEADEQEAEAELEEFISACREYDDQSDTESYVDDNTYWIILISSDNTKSMGNKLIKNSRALK